MLVNKSFETPEGTLHFQGELTAMELDYVLQIGLNQLLQMGAVSKTSGTGLTTTELPQ